MNLKIFYSKLPIEYHKILSETHKANTKLPQETVSSQKKTDVNSEKKMEKVSFMYLISFFSLIKYNCVF